MHVVIGSRESQLAMIQTEYVKARLEATFPSISFSINGMTTTGDEIQDVSLQKIGEKSLFTKELEVALADKRVDLVVHSLKDLPTTLPPGMVVGAMTIREDPRDAVSMSGKNKGKLIQNLGPGSVIGTSSVRRSAQLRKEFPHLVFQDVRGNLNTRLRKLDADDSPYEALLLAYAGVHRMGWDERVSQVLEPDVMLHAVGQGALGIECREGDAKILEIVHVLNDINTNLRCTAERSFMRALEGGCSVPLGVFTTVEQQSKGLLLSLVGSATSLDGSEQIKQSDIILVESTDLSSRLEKANELGINVAKKLADLGAGRILDAIRNSKK